MTILSSEMDVLETAPRLDLALLIILVPMLAVVAGSLNLGVLEAVPAGLLLFRYKEMRVLGGFEGNGERPASSRRTSADFVKFLLSKGSWRSCFSLYVIFVWATY